MTKGDQEKKFLVPNSVCISEVAPLTLWWYLPVTEAFTKPHPEFLCAEEILSMGATKGMDFKCPRCLDCSLH